MGQIKDCKTMQCQYKKKIHGHQTYFKLLLTFNVISKLMT